MDTREVKQITKLLGDLTAVDVAEVFSPPRFTKRAKNFGLKPGFSADITEWMDEYEKWNLMKPEHEAEMKRRQTKEDPYLLTGSPPCEGFSIISRGWNWYKAGFKKARVLGKHLLKVSCRAYWRQIAAGKYFLHEHPWSADSWDEPCIRELMQREDVYVVKGPMCCWDMMDSDELGEGYIRKETGWMTNCPELAAILEGVCSNVDGSREWHRHIHLKDGRTHRARVYPPELVAAVLKGIKKQMISDGCLSELHSLVAGPVPIEPVEEWHLEPDQYWDDVNGGWLIPEKVRAARAEELAWVKKQGVYEITDESICWSETGQPPITLKWVDTNKGDDEKPNYRSRLVVREIKAKSKGTSREIEASQLFSGMPPLEALKLQLSLMVTKKKSKRGKPLKLALWDISRAHFYGTAQRRVFITLPDEEYQPGK